MAEVRSGSFRTTGYSDPGYTDHYVFSWELVSQSIVNCTSTIKWSVVGAGASNSAYWTYVQEKYVTVNGVTQTNTTKVATYNGTVAFSGQSVIKHSTTTGKGSFSASCGGAFYSYGSYNSTGSGSWNLPTIARATMPAFSATGVELGKSINVGLTPADSSFKHKLTYSVGSLTGQTAGLASGGNFTAAGNVTIVFTPPTSLGAQFPNANSTNCTITCYTYNSSGTLIGTTTNAFNLNVPSYTPSGSVAITGVNLLSSTYVQGKSSATVTITASSSYGATIQSYSTVLDGKTYTAQKFTSSVLSTGTKTAKVTVKDSRGKSVTVDSSSITVYAYSIPYITSFSLARQTDGTTVIATLKGGFAAVNNKNAKTVKVTLNGVTNTVTTSAYTFDTTTTFTGVSTDQTFTSTLTLTDSYTTVTATSVLPTVAVTMDFHNSGKGIAMGKVAETSNLLDVNWNERVRKNLTVDGTHSVTGNATVGGTLGVTGVTTLNKVTTIADTDWKTLILKRVNAIGAVTIQFQNNTGSLGFIGMTGNELNTSLKRWTSDGVTAYTVLDTGLVKDFVVEQGTSGIWTYRKWNSGLAECWGVYTMTSAATKTWGSLYYSDTLAPRINYPFTFASRPQESAFLHGSSVAGWVYPEAGGIGLNTTTQTGQYGFVRPTTIASSEVKYEYTVVGRWK